MLNISVAVVDDAFVEAFVILLEGLHSQDGRIGLSVGPGLETAALHGQIFEALKK